MSKIIALSCTQKKQPSLTDDLLQAAISGFLKESPDAEIVPIRLIDYNLQLCQGEDTCLDVGHCTLTDDYNKIVEKAFHANGMILCMPVYGGNVPAILKILMERLKSFMNHKERPFGGLNVCTIVHSRTMMTEAAMGALSPWYTRLNNKNVVSVCFTQAGHGDIIQTKIPELCYGAGQQLALSFKPQTSSSSARSKCTCG